MGDHGNQQVCEEVKELFAALDRADSIELDSQMFSFGMGKPNIEVVASEMCVVGGTQDGVVTVLPSVSSPGATVPPSPNSDITELIGGGSDMSNSSIEGAMPRRSHVDVKHYEFASTTEFSVLSRG